MKTKSTIKVIGASVLALALAYCGNGANRNPIPTARGAFKPMVARDVDFAVGVNLDKEQALKVVDAYANLALEALKLSGGNDGKEIEETKEQIVSFIKDPFQRAPAEAHRFLEKSGLRNAEIHWAVLSVSDFKMVEDTPLLGGVSLAVAGTIDVDKLISAIRQEEDCDVLFEKTQIGGETAWHVVQEKAEDRKKMAEAHVDPYVTSLDGRLVLVAMSREALATQIRLYRGWRGNGDALSGFSASDGELLHLHLSGVGDILRKNVPRRQFEVLNYVIPNGDELVFGLEDLDIRLNVAPSGMLRDSLRLGTASENDADNLRTLAKTGLMVLNAQLARLSKEPRVANLVSKTFGELKVGGTGRQFEFRGGSFLLVAAGALFPAISGAILSANGATMSIQGRKLVTGIIQVNIDRKGKADPVWPRTKVDGDRVTSIDDIASYVSKSATDYFNALFDMEHYGTAKWDPCVDGELLSTLWGCGVPGMSGTRLEKRNVAWTIAANVTDETPDFIPVLITANFNPSLLLSKWDGKTNDSERLPIGPESGAAATPFGDKAVVIVRKSGAAEVIKAKDLTYDRLYKKTAFDLTKMKPPLKYLTPSGIAEPSRRDALPCDLTGGEPSLESLNLTASIYAQSGQTLKAREVYEKTLERDAANHEALMGLWLLSVKEGAFDKAKDYLKRAVEAPVREGTVRMDAALLHMTNNDLDAAREELSRITYLHPNSMQGWMLLAGVVLQQADNVKDDKKRQDILAEVDNVILPKMEKLVTSPRDFRVQMVRALVLMRRGDDEDSMKRARGALELAWMSRPEVSVGVMILDLDYRLLDRKSAERHALQILRLDEGHPYANWVMGSIRMMEGKMSEAEKYLRVSATSKHPPAAAQNDLAELLRKSGRLEEAEKYARAGTQNNPKLYVVWATLCDTLLDQNKNLDEAEQCANKAIELSEGKDLRMQLTLARVQVAKGNFAQARSTIRELVKRREELSKSDQAVLDDLQKEIN